MALKTIINGVALAGLLLAAAPAVQAQSGTAASEASHPPLNNQVTFLYYADVAAADAFYGNVLGLKKTFDEPWVKFYQVTEHSYVGLVDGKNGFHKATEGKAVMVSIETDQVEQWYERMKAKNADFIKHFDPKGTHLFVNGFLVKDPGGYTVEFYRWKKKPGG